MKTCIGCPEHEVIADPDPYDWFCDDDVAVICKLKPTKIKKDSRHAGDRSGFRTITVACRPYNIRKECEVPDWCPKNKAKKAKSRAS